MYDGENLSAFSVGLGFAEDSVMKYSARKRSLFTTKGRNWTGLLVHCKPLSVGVDASAQLET